MRKVGFKGLLLLVGYAVAYGVLREVSVSTWLLPAGLRFVALLFLPYRFWPAIIAGDCLASAHYRGHMIELFGAPWFATQLAGPVISSAIPAALLKSLNWGDNLSNLAKTIGGFLTGGVLASILSATTAVYSLTLMPKFKMPMSWAGLFGAFTLGDFLGILLVGLVAIYALIKIRLPQAIENDRHKLSTLGFAWIAAHCAFFMVVLVAINRTSTTEEAVIATRALLFVPLLVMGIRHGWLGATCALLMCNLALQATMRNVLKTSLLEMQCFMAIFGSAMLIGGSMITEFQIRAAALAKESRRHLELARQNLTWGELRARQSASILESAYTVFQNEDNLELVATGSGQTAAVRANHRWVALGGVRRDIRQAVELLQVQTLDTHGLPIALAIGPIATAMEEAGISYAVRVSGNMRAIPSDMNMLVYRLVYDFTVRLATKHAARKIRVRLIAGRERKASFAIVVRATTGQGPAPRLPAPYFATPEIKGIAATYHGIYHKRTNRRRPTLAILLRDS